MIGSNQNSVSAPGTSSQKHHEPVVAKAIGGMAGGISEVMLFHPVDTLVKGKMNSTKVLPSGQYLNGVAVKRLYSGVGCALLYKTTQRVYKLSGQALIQNHLVNSKLDHWLSANVSDVSREVTMSAVSGAMIGAAEVVLLPLDRMKVRKQINPESVFTLKSGSNQNFLQTCYRGYRGLNCTLARNISGSAGFFVGNNTALMLMNSNCKDNGLVEYTVSSLTGAFTSIVVSSPMDVVKVRMQAADTSKVVSSEVIKNMIRTEGVRSFGNGMGTKLLCTMPKLAFSMTLAQTVSATVSGWTSGDSKSHQHNTEK